MGQIGANIWNPKSLDLFFESISVIDVLKTIK